MFGIGRRSFEARTLAVLRGDLQPPLGVTLAPLEEQLLRDVVASTRRDRGTPLDAALRFYAALAEMTKNRGDRMVDVGFVFIRARALAAQKRMKFRDEHHQALRALLGTGWDEARG